ncbi:MAG TPA: oxygen-independent coproporphyrinogen III oxidase [Gammaproteobacteria bacterium]|nr:oxygen-independent coproporphyrinogen III oxidase [Gammaproteobacteria bacterium]
MQPSIYFDADLIRRYAGSGPRYTSYPTAMEFTPEVGEAEHECWVRESNQSGRPLSLYVHIPFCAHVCYYCACNKVVTADRSRARPYLDALYREIRLQASLVEADRPVEQLHFGGGTPTFLDESQLGGLMGQLRENFRLLDDDRGEYSIEIDPRELRDSTLEVLRGLGFNRLSLGVQDIDPAVQQAVHREQPLDQTLAVLSEARALGFRSTNLDLMYGLPLQTVESFSRTLDAVIDARPERLSVFNYAHLPERFKPQRRIDAGDLPGADEKLAILQLTIDRLTRSGYQYIGMDHFALHEDELAQAQRAGSLHRNFQGYSTHADSDLVAMGVSAISSLPGGYTQNHTGLEAYYEALETARLPVWRGVAIEPDDRLRAEVIQQLICHGELDVAAIEDTFGIQFADYFSEELGRLQAMQEDGLLELDAGHLRITERGRLLVRNICMVFDRYRKNEEERFSRLI